MEAHLQEADLRGAHLQEADLRGARLQEAVLWGARLQEANLRGARLQGADLLGARLQEANLGEAHLQGANLQRACLQGANLGEAHLQGAVWWDTHLQAAVLSGADLRGAEAVWISTYSFADRMRAAIDKKSNLSGVVFEGGLNPEDVDSLVEDLSDAGAKALRSKLEHHHVGRREVRGVPEMLGVKQEAYFKEKAEQWIAEYDEAMSEVPEDQ